MQLLFLNDQLSLMSNPQASWDFSEKVIFNPISSPIFVLTVLRDMPNIEKAQSKDVLAEAEERRGQPHLLTLPKTFVVGPPQSISAPHPCFCPALTTGTHCLLSPHGLDSSCLPPSNCPSSPRTQLSSIPLAPTYQGHYPTETTLG